MRLACWDEKHGEEQRRMEIPETERQQHGAWGAWGGSGGKGRLSPAAGNASERGSQAQPRLGASTLRGALGPVEGGRKCSTTAAKALLGGIKHLTIPSMNHSLAETRRRP